MQIKLQKILDKTTFEGGTINGRILPVVLLVLKSNHLFGILLTESAVQCLSKLMLVKYVTKKFFILKLIFLQ